jgi:hypothetical protein
MLFKVLSVFIVSSLMLFSQDYVRIKFNVTTSNGEKFKDMYIGVHPDATFDIDYELGEKSKPPFPPPGNLHCALIWPDTLQDDSIENIHSDEVYYPMPDKEKFHYRYNLYIRKDNIYDTAIVKWANVSEYIDSAFFSDIAEYLFKVDMKKQNEYKIGGNAIFIDDFIFDIYFTKTPTSISGDLIYKNFDLYPNPATDVLFLNNHYAEVTVYDLAGNSIRNLSNTALIDISDMKSGMYIIRLGNDKKYINKKFIKN